MANPNRILISNNLKSTLEGINGTGAFTTDVKQVDRGPHRASNEIAGPEMPYIGFEEGESTYAIRLHPNTYKVVFPIGLVLQVSGPEEAVTSLKLSNLYDDVVHAVSVDWTRGGYATNSLIISDTPMQLNKEGTIARMGIVLEIHYVRTDTAGS